MKKYTLVVLLLLPFVGMGQIITTIAGGGSGGDGGPASLASLNDPACLTIDRYGNLYFTENLGYAVRKIDPAGIITTIAGTGSVGYGGDGGPATAALLNQPLAIAVDSFGNVYIDDNLNNRIRKVNVSTGIITTIAGSSSLGFGGDGGLATAALLKYPSALFIDKYQNIYIGDFQNYRIRKINTAGIISTVAGNGIFGSDGDGGPATLAKVIPGLICADNAGNLYVSEAASLGIIRKINNDGIITTIAGDSASVYYNGDGMPATATNMDPEGITIGPDNLLYFSDRLNNRLRVINASGIVHTIAGTGIAGYTGDGGLADTAEMYYPLGLEFDHCGNLFVCQVVGGVIRKITYPHCGYLSTPEVHLPASEITIYPNPAHTELHIQSPTALQTITITNMLGQIVYTGEFNDKQATINIEKLQSGVYFVRVNGWWVEKLIKE